MKSIFQATTVETRKFKVFGARVEFFLELPVVGILDTEVDIKIY